MTTGPIDFGEEQPHEQLFTEYGGTGGLIQPEFVDGKEAHTELTPGEKHGVAIRHGLVPLNSHEAWTGEADDERILDPHTGRVVDPVDLEDASGGSDGKPLSSALKP